MKKMLSDPWLILLLLLLTGSLGLFFIGILPYPFGLLILSVLLFTRFLFLLPDSNSRENK